MEFKNLSDKVNHYLSYLKSLDLKNLPLGRVDVDKDFYYSVSEYEARNAPSYESHYRYIDIQIIINGEEIFLLNDISHLRPNSEYIKENDIIFYDLDDVHMKALLKEGDYIILYPGNAHGFEISTPCKIKKVVGKVLID